MIYSDKGGWSLSAVSASAFGSAISLRAGNGAFMMIVSASSNGPSGGASALIQMQHAHDLTAWTNLGPLWTASSTGAANPFLTASYTAGAYGYVRVWASAVWSAAQTGTGVLYAYILPGYN